MTKKTDSTFQDRQAMKEEDEIEIVELGKKRDDPEKVVLVEEEEQFDDE